MYWRNLVCPVHLTAPNVLLLGLWSCYLGTARAREGIIPDGWDAIGRSLVRIGHRLALFLLRGDTTTVAEDDCKDGDGKRMNTKVLHCY